MPEDHSVERLYEELLTAWNERDAARFGGCFTPDGSMVGFDGSPVDTAASISEHLSAIFADHRPAAYVAEVREVRVLTEGVALLRAVAGMVPPGETHIKADLNAVQSLVAIETTGGWHAAHLHTTPAAFHGRPDAVARLTAELEEARATGAVVRRR